MDKRLNIPEPSSIRGSRIPLVRHAMGQIIARQSKRRLIALGMLLTALVAGGLLIAQAIDRDAPAGTTVAVGFSPQGVLVDSRTRHVFTLDGVGVDRQGRYLQTGAVSMLDAGTGAVLRSMPVGQSPTWITDDERTRRAFVIVLGGGGANGLLVRTLDTTSGAVLGTAVLLTSSSTGGSVRLGPGVTAVDEPAGHVFVINRVGYPPAPVAPLLWMLDARSGQLLRTVHLPAAPAAIAIDPQTHRAFVTSATSPVMWMLNADSGVVLRTIPVSGGAATVTVDARTDRVLVATAAATGRLLVFDAHTGSLRQSIAAGPYPSMILVDERRERAFVLDQGSLVFNATGSVSTVDLRRGLLVGTVTVGVNPMAIALHEGSGRVFVLNQETSTRNGTVSVLATSGSLLQTIRVGLQPSALAIDEPSGHVFVTSQAASTPRPDALWSLIERVREFMAVNGSDNRGVVTMLDAGR